MTDAHMKRAIVIGCPGSGKSTFSRALRDLTGIPLIHLDALYWKPDRTTVTREEFDEKLNAAMNNESWIIDGNFQRTLETRIERCDTVFFLDIPTDICLDGISSRKGQPRSDMPWVENEDEADSDLEDFVKAFETDGKPFILTLLKKYPDKKVYKFTSRAEIDKFLYNMRHNEV